MNFYLFFTGFVLPVVFISLESVFYYFIKFKTILFQFLKMNHMNEIQMASERQKAKVEQRLSAAKASYEVRTAKLLMLGSIRVGISRRIPSLLLRAVNN